MAPISNPNPPITIPTISPGPSLSLFDELAEPELLEVGVVVTEEPVFGRVED